MNAKLHHILGFIKHFLVAKRKGHGIHSPFVYQLCEEVFYNTATFYDFEELAQLRETLLTDDTLLKVGTFGAGSKVFSGENRKVKDIAKNGISSRHQSEIIYRLINFLKCKNCIELGTSLGLNTLYMAKAVPNGNVISVEGNSALNKHASEFAMKSNVSNIHFIAADFDLVLKDVINRVSTLDFLYIDGNHTFEATVHYFDEAALKIHDHSVIMIDDIYWSQDMTRAWNKIKAGQQVTLSIDCFNFGLIFFRPEIKEKIQLKLFL